MKCPPDIFASVVAELLERGVTAKFRVHGTSMHPTIKDGEVVRIARAGSRPIQAGDIVAFRRDEGMCVHRAARVERDGKGDLARVLTTGDGLWTADGFYPAADILGVVVEVETSRGTWCPTTPLRRAQGRLRAFLTMHPQVRSPLRVAKLRWFRAQQLAREGRSRRNEGLGS